MNRTTALIADDEPLLRERLRMLLGRLWPELSVVAEARNGREAIAHFEAHRPDIAFLDVQMPAGSGLDAARAIARRARIVFVTAHEQYALAAFEHGAVDYLVKPFEERRLADTVQRLREGLSRHEPIDAAAVDAAVSRIAEALRRPAPAGHLQWLRASSGTSVRVIATDEVAFFRSDEKYTLVACRDGSEALIRRAIRELVDELDPALFVQVHRSVIVNLRQVARVERGPNETAEVQLKTRPERLPVSRSYLHLFRQM